MIPMICDHGQSSAAVYIEMAKRDVLQRFDSLVSSRKQVALEQLAEIQQSCRVPNWDSDGAKAIADSTVWFARALIDSLPIALPMPSISGEPDGHIDLEWYRSPNRVLSVSVSPDGTLYWAALIGTEDPRASCPYYGDEIPRTIRDLVQRIVFA